MVINNTFTSILIISSILSVSNLNAEFCPTCHIKKVKNMKKGEKKLTPFKKSSNLFQYNTQNPNNPNYILPLDEDNNQNIKIVSNNIQQIDENSILKEGDIMYVCEDTKYKKILCDSITKMCECV